MNAARGKRHFTHDELLLDLVFPDQKSNPSENPYYICECGSKATCADCGIEYCFKQRYGTEPMCTAMVGLCVKCVTNGSIESCECDECRLDK